MAALRPIHYKKFEQFLLKVGCHFVRQEGDHRAWDRGDLLRPVIVRTKKDLPIFEIKSPSTPLGMVRGIVSLSNHNLRTLRISTAEYLKILEQI